MATKRVRASAIVAETKGVILFGDLETMPRVLFSMRWCRRPARAVVLACCLRDYATVRSAIVGV